MEQALIRLADRRNVAGLVGALLALALKFGGVIDAWWLPILIGLYFAGFLLVQLIAPPQPLELAAVPVADLAADLQRLMRRLGPQLPPAAQEHLTHILAAVTAIEPRLREIDPLNASLVTIRQIVAQYIPASLTAYVALPYVMRAKRSSGGKSADEQLVAQLALLDAQMEQLVETLASGDLEALEVQGRFLETKFNSPEIFSAS